MTGRIRMEEIELCFVLAAISIRRKIAVKGE
jgi:hypothetical protein